jgi:L-lysine 6-transaminase
MPDTLTANPGQVVTQSPIAPPTKAEPMKSEEKPTTKNPIKIPPNEVHTSLAKHMLVDGFDLIIDLKRSQGSYVFDSRYNKRYLDFFTFFASGSVGLNHPRLTSPDFLEKLGYVAVNKVSNSDAYTVEMAEFVETFARIAQPEYLPYTFFVDGGALAVENALKTAFDWKTRKNFIKGYTEERGRQVIHFRKAFHGRSGYTLSLTNTDPIKTNYFPKFRWPRIHNPVIEFPLNKENLARVQKAESIALQQIKQAIINNPDDIAAIIIEPIQCEGGDNHFRKEFFLQLRNICDESEILLIFDEVQTGVGITGKMWAHEYYVKPDMVAFGKKTQICGFMCGLTMCSKMFFTSPAGSTRRSAEIWLTWCASSGFWKSSRRKSWWTMRGLSGHICSRNWRISNGNSRALPPMRGDLDCSVRLISIPHKTGTSSGARRTKRG